MNRPLATLFAAAALATAVATPFGPAQALVVYDAKNHVTNILQAARALQQINNQIQSLTNEAQSLINDARNLANLPYSALAPLKASIARTQALLAAAQRLAYDVTDIEAAFKAAYGEATPAQTDAQLLANARDRWKTALGSFEDALKVQAGVVGNLDTNRAELDALVTASQGATGAMQVAQAGNQLVALQTQQLADLTAAVAAAGRAQALEAAQRASASDQAREQLRRFLTPGPGYTPTPITMFRP